MMSTRCAAWIWPAAVIIVFGMFNSLDAKDVYPLPKDLAPAVGAKDIAMPDISLEEKLLTRAFFESSNYNCAFSPDGRRAAYVFRGDKGCHVVLGEAIGERYDDVDNIIFSPDGLRIAYVVRIDSKVRIVVDNKPEPETHDGISPITFTFSPDSQHVRYIAYDGEKE